MSISLTFDQTLELIIEKVNVHFTFSYTYFNYVLKMRSENEFNICVSEKVE